MGPKFFLFHMLTCEVHLPLYGCPHIDLHASMQLAACSMQPTRPRLGARKFFFLFSYSLVFYSFSSIFSFFPLLLFFLLIRYVYQFFFISSPSTYFSFIFISSQTFLILSFATFYCFYILFHSS